MKKWAVFRTLLSSAETYAFRVSPANGIRFPLCAVLLIVSGAYSKRTTVTSYCVLAHCSLRSLFANHMVSILLYAKSADASKGYINGAMRSSILSAPVRVEDVKTMNPDKTDNMNEIERLVAFLMSCIPDVVKNILSVSTVLQGLDKNDDGTVTVAVKADGTVSKTGKGKHVFGPVQLPDLFGAISVLARKLESEMALPAPTPTATAPAGIIYKARATITAMVNGVIHVSTYCYMGPQNGRKMSASSKATCKAGVTVNKVRVTAHSQPAYYLLNGILLSGGFRLLTDGVDWKVFEQNCWTALRSLGALTGKEEPKNVIYQDDRLAQLHAGYAKVDNIPTITVDEARSASIEAGLAVVEAGQQTTTVSRAKPVYDLDI